jgi:hypothetical protein
MDLLSSVSEELILDSQLSVDLKNLWMVNLHSATCQNNNIFRHIYVFQLIFLVDTDYILCEVHTEEMTCT